MRFNFADAQNQRAHVAHIYNKRILISFHVKVIYAIYDYKLVYVPHAFHKNKYKYCVYLEIKPCLLNSVILYLVSNVNFIII